MIFLYDDQKEEDYFKSAKALSDKGFTHIIFNNFMPSKELINHIKKNHMEPCICTKLYNDDYLIDIPQIIKLGATVALDGEAYSGSNIWMNKDTANIIIDNVKKMVSGCYKVIVLPENLGGDKYKYYPIFLDLLSRSTKIIILMERTYQEWKPWEIIKFWCRNKGYKKVIGVWPAKLNFFCKLIQRLTVKFLSKSLFFYSENKTDWENYDKINY